MLPPPKNVELPFFAYGAFKPGELAFLQLKDLVVTCRQGCAIQGGLRIRDGLPIASPDEEGEIPGALLLFRAGCEAEAYERIGRLEPESQYRWRVIDGESGPCNYLAGRSPNKGSVRSDDPDWTGQRDPLFTSAIDVVDETFQQNRDFEWDLKPLFRLEMAYLLLWTAIERYASLRYHLGDKATWKVMNIAEEQAFQRALQRHVTEGREVCRSDDPTEKCRLEATRPKRALEYYYQLRHNLVHRGKGVPHDHDRIRKSLQELLAIFRDIVAAAFEESKWTDGAT